MHYDAIVQIGGGASSSGSAGATLPPGIIVMWGGLLANIPVGWALCDGTNGTPDLRDRFIKGTSAGADPGGTGGSATHTPTGTVSQPTFTGSALGTHSHGVGTYATSSHAGTAVADHASHTHSVTSNVIVGDHASHTHSVTSNVAVGDHASHTHSIAQSSFSTTKMTANASGTACYTSGGTVTTPSGGPSAILTHSVTNNAVTSGGPSATLSHSVTNNTVISGGPSATLTHSVTQPNDHTLSGSSAAVSAGTPAGTVSQPTFTGDSINTEPAYYKLAFIQKL